MFEEKHQTWKASIQENNKTKFLGNYLTYEEARLAREQAEGESEFCKKGYNINFSDVKSFDNNVNSKHQVKAFDLCLSSTYQIRITRRQFYA